MGEWIAPPTKPGWYWWRKQAGYGAIPVQVGPGPFGNDVYVPGKGWCLKDLIGGQWYTEKIKEPK